MSHGSPNYAEKLRFSGHQQQFAFLNILPKQFVIIWLSNLLYLLHFVSSDY